MRDSDKKYQREAALILIAIAASVKVYPAVFGLLYIIERRWKEAIRLIIYGIIFFFFPFIVFGGINGFKMFLSNQKAVQNMEYIGLSSLKSLYNKIATKTGHSKNEVVPVIIIAVFTLASIISAFYQKEIWKSVNVITSLMILYPFWSGSYTLIYMALPFVLFFAEKREKTLDYIYAVMFAVMFAFCVLTSQNPSLNSVFVSLRYYALYSLDIVLIIGGLYNCVSHNLKKYSAKYH